LPAGALDDVARDIKGGARLRDWLPAVLRIVEPDVVLTEAHLDAFDKHEEARAAARASGLRAAEALLAGTVASVNVDQLRVALGQRPPLLLGVLERYMVTRAAGPQQPQQPTWSIRRQKLGVGAFERASHADVTHARAKALERKAAEAKADAKAKAKADAKAKAEAQLAREAKIAEREAQTKARERQERHADCRAPAPRLRRSKWCSTRRRSLRVASGAWRRRTSALPRSKSCAGRRESEPSKRSSEHSARPRLTRRPRSRCPRSKRRSHCRSRSTC
jgi:hypothetical protein